jgi:hypothetical protein
MSGFKGEAIVDDGGEKKGRDQELQDPKEAIVHVVVWVFGRPDRSGWVNGSDYLGGVNPEISAVAILDLDTPPSVNVLPDSLWTMKPGSG